MYNIETKNRFIELRAEGLSLDAISDQLSVPKTTLGRWHHESLEQIQRLRALQWHLLEEQIGQRLEDTLRHIAQRLQKWDDKLDRQLTVYQKPGDTIRVIRESRREYLQLRAILLAPLHPARRHTPCPPLLDSEKRDKTGQNPDTLDTTSLPTNDLQQPQPAASHFATVEEPAFGGASTLVPTIPSPCPANPVTPEVTRGPTSQCTLDNPPSSRDRAALAHNLNHNPDPSASPLLDTEPPIDTPLLCGEPSDAQPPINTPLQRGAPTEPSATPTASAVSSFPQGESVSSSLAGDNVAAGVSPGDANGS